MTPRLQIGVLALQGDYEAHKRALEKLDDILVTYVRTPEDLDRVDGLVLPGGESTAIVKLMQRISLDSALKMRAEQGMPMFGTCAGMIVLASAVEGAPNQPTLSVLDVVVARNAFGRQIDSFEADISVQIGGNSESVRGVFIRAPYVLSSGSQVNVLGTYHERTVVVRQNNILASAFHPELTDDIRMHRLFTEMVKSSKR